MKRCALLLVLLAMAAPALAVWPPPVRLTDGPNDNINPDIFVPEAPQTYWDTLFLVWQRSRPGGWDIYSQKNGDSLWLSPELVSSLPDSNLTPAIAATNRYRTCVWVNCHADSQDILCSRWSGSVWGPALNLTQDRYPDVEPAIWCNPIVDSVVVAWASLRNGRWSLYSRFYGGTSWSVVYPIVQNSGNNRRPRLDRDRFGRFNVVWQSDVAGNWDVRLSRFVGGIWTAPQQVTTGPQSDMQPSHVKGAYQYYLAVDLVWTNDSLGNYEIFGTNCDTLLARERLTAHDSSDAEPSALHHNLPILMPALNIPMLTAWTSQRDGNPNIYAWLAVRGGPQAVDTNRAVDRHPCVGVFFPWLFYHEWVVWESNRDGNWNLYGSFQMVYHDAVETGEKVKGAVAETKGIRPSPFYPPGDIALALSGDRAAVSLSFYDLQGRLLCERKTTKRAPGQYELTWDGRDASGNLLPSGLYFLRAEGVPALYRLILLR